MAFYRLCRADNKKIEIGIEYNSITLAITGLTIKGSSTKILNYAIDRDINNVLVRFKTGTNQDLTTEKEILKLNISKLFMRDVTDPLEEAGALGIMPPANFKHMRFEFI